MTKNTSTSVNKLMGSKVTAAKVDAEKATRRNPKGAITRQKIISAFVEMLDEYPVWEIKVSMLTRRIGISSQLLYVHFKKIEDILLAQAQVILEENPDLSVLIDGDWEGQGGIERATKIIEETLSFWDRHRTIMKVIEILDEAHNPLFSHFRAARGKANVAAFKRIVDQQIKKGKLSPELDSEFAAWNVVSRLQVFAAWYPEAITIGQSREAVIHTTALMTQSSLGFDF
jgi:AcrR family transcriptional regulator